LNVGLALEFLFAIGLPYVWYEYTEYAAFQFHLADQIPTYSVYWDDLMAHFFGNETFFDFLN
jgi:hypothetical protein